MQYPRPVQTSFLLKRLSPKLTWVRGRHEKDGRVCGWRVPLSPRRRLRTRVRNPYIRDRARCDGLRLTDKFLFHSPFNAAEFAANPFDEPRLKVIATHHLGDARSFDYCSYKYITLFEGCYRLFQGGSCQAKPSQGKTHHNQDEA